MNKLYIKSLFGVFLIIVTVLSSCGRVMKEDYLKDGFLNPPDSCRPGVYWYFMDGNISREAISRDLESMKSAGIGYVLFLEVNVGVPRGKVEFMSDEWLDLFTHIVRETERLGIRLIVGSGPGWAGSGGPWVKPGQSMMHLVASDTVLTGPSIFNSTLPVPAPRVPYFGKESLSPELEMLRNNWYKNVRVLAFPLPEKDRKLDSIDEKALFYRPPYTSSPDVLPFIRVLSATASDNDGIVMKERIIDLTNQMDTNGKVTWNVPPGKWKVLRFVARNNGSATRPAPDGGLGFEADKFDTSAFRSHFDNFTGRLLQRSAPLKRTNGGGWKMIHIDSWEMGAQNWSDSFIEEFIRRRGYDPVLYLPVFEGYIVSNTEISERFLWDVRQTASELVLENHAGWFRDIGHRNGFRLSIEPYDMNPAGDLDLGAVADIPMCEFWSDGFGYNSSYSSFEATSVAHTTGKQVVAAEAFTSDATEAWKLYPGNMKNQTDWALCSGINRFIFHTFAHQPLADNLLPGMTMGPYGVHWDRNQTWWPLVRPYHDYLARSQYLLSRGRPVADILYMTPEGAPQVFVPPFDAIEGSDGLPDKKSFSFDACSPSILMKYATVQAKHVVFPGGASYRILVLPDVDAITPEYARKLESLIKAGATVIGIPPTRSPSLFHYPDCDAEVKKITEPLWGNLRGTKAIESHFYFAGTVYWPDKEYVYTPATDSLPYAYLYPKYSIIESLLKTMGKIPDFVSAGNYRYIHRSLPEREIYFISNRTDKPCSDSCFFRDGTLAAELWDPVTGKIKKIENIIRGRSGVGLLLKLEPEQSCFLVFNTDKNVNEPKITSDQDSGLEILAAIDGPWQVDFNPTMGGAGKTVFDSLYDWRNSSNEGIKYYSGIAKYFKRFSLQSPLPTKNAGELFLELGTVRNICRVKLNGKDLGVIWTYPWEVDITGLLNREENILEIEVANLWINRLIGDEDKPWDGIVNGQWPEWLQDKDVRASGRITFTTHRFYKKGDQLSESGLLGPVRVVMKSRGAVSTK